MPKDGTEEKLKEEFKLVNPQRENGGSYRNFYVGPQESKDFIITREQYKLLPGEKITFFALRLKDEKIYKKRYDEKRLPSVRYVKSKATGRKYLMIRNGIPGQNENGYWFAEDPAEKDDKKKDMRTVRDLFEI